jgi:hypothetical protein
MSARKAIRITALGILVTATVGLLVMAAVGTRLYTSAGVDLESAEGEQVRQTYFRVRWPGNGQIWFGGGGKLRPAKQKPLEAFDPACSAFRKPGRLPVPTTLAERLGFWWIVNPARDPSDGYRHPVRLNWGFWLGMPAWLPAFVTALLAWRLGRRKVIPTTPVTSDNEGKG